jgi:peptide/nickel transport system substrate-binding protein
MLRHPATRHRFRAPSTVLASLVAAFALVGCSGGGDEGGTAQGTTSTPAPVENADKGGKITVLSAGDVDFIDPGQAYYQYSYEVMYATQRPLLASKPNSVELSPDLAEAMPTVSKDGRTVTVKIRSGVRYSPPVNRAVTSADVKYAIERSFASSVANGYTGAYFGELVGAPSAPTKGVKDISGIRTPDKRTIVFRLKEPSGAFVSALGQLVTAPVPREYASKFDAKTQSDYGMHQVATGPYMIKNKASGSISGVGYQPGRMIDLVRNPNWSPDTSWRPAYADEIVFRQGFQDPTVMTRQILGGSGDVNGDTPPPPAMLRSITSNSAQKDQLYFTPVGGARYIALNTQKPPFDNKFVRMAVAYVLDRNALRLTRGGAIDGEIGTHFVDPSFKGAGFEAAGGATFDPFATPNHAGSVEKARAMLKKAGFSSGRFTVPQVTQVADNTPPGSNTAKVVAADLAKIGIRVKTISVTHSTMYTRFCNVPKNQPNICPNVGWIPDFHDPQTSLDVTFNGARITQVNNSNWPQLNDPKINAAIDRAKRLIDPQDRAEAWGKIDDMVTRTAGAIPWLWEDWPTLFSDRVTPAPTLWNGGAPDVTFMAVEGQ